MYEIPYETWAYEQHLFFIDFNRFHVAWEDQPNMINIMRQPIARRISDIYFKFTDQIKLDNSAKLNLEQCIQRRRGHCIVGNLQIITYFETFQIMQEISLIKFTSSPPQKKTKKKTKQKKSIKKISKFLTFQSRPSAHQSCFFAGNIPACLEDTDRPKPSGDTKLQKYHIDKKFT